MGKVLSLLIGAIVTVVGIILLILYLTGRSLSIETGTRKIE